MESRRARAWGRSGEKVKSEKRQAASGRPRRPGAVKKDRATRAWGRSSGARRTTAMLVVNWLLSNDQLFNIPASASELHNMRLRSVYSEHNAPQGEVVLLPA